MTRIGLLSDTHGYYDPQLNSCLRECDEIWHAGDFGNMKVYDGLMKIQKPVRGVYGNIDGKEIRELFNEEESFTIEDKHIFMTHIGGSPGKYPSRIRERMLDLKPGIFVCGHSHILKIIYDHKMNLLFLNPGAAGKEGFHKVRTMLRFTIDGSNIKDMEVIELGTRQVPNNIIPLF